MLTGPPPKFHGTRDILRIPTVAVLSGTTGFGKSTIAADFCHLNRYFHEHVCWIDSRSPELLEARIIVPPLA